MCLTETWGKDKEFLDHIFLISMVCIKSELVDGVEGLLYMFIKEFKICNILSSFTINDDFL